MTEDIMCPIYGVVRRDDREMAKFFIPLWAVKSAIKDFQLQVLLEYIVYLTAFRRESGMSLRNVNIEAG